jgi:hypothetical protein
MRVAAPLLLLLGVLTTAGCGGGGAATSPAALRLQREDLVAASHALQSVEQPVAHEVASTKTAWRLIANGLPARTIAIARPSILAAAESTKSIKQPGLFEESEAASLTGPASQLAGLFSTFSGLASRGWQQIVATIDAIEHGSPADARFARENVAFYIDSVYDGHFSLAQIGKKLKDGYHKLGGQAAFGTALSQAEVNALANTYSEAAERLHPHVGVRFGS